MTIWFLIKITAIHRLINTHSLSVHRQFKNNKCNNNTHRTPQRRKIVIDFQMFIRHNSSEKFLFPRNLSVHQGFELLHLYFLFICVMVTALVFKFVMFVLNFFLLKIVFILSKITSARISHGCLFLKKPKKIFLFNQKQRCLNARNLKKSRRWKTFDRTAYLDNQISSSIQHRISTLRLKNSNGCSCCARYWKVY